MRVRTSLRRASNPAVLVRFRPGLRPMRGRLFCTERMSDLSNVFNGDYRARPFPLQPPLTTREVAAILGCSARHVARLTAAGEIEAVVLGPRTRRYAPESVAAFIAARRSRP